MNLGNAGASLSQEIQRVVSGLLDPIDVKAKRHKLRIRVFEHIAPLPGTGLQLYLVIVKTKICTFRC
jgi:hypothetical protein